MRVSVHGERGKGVNEERGLVSLLLLVSRHSLKDTHVPPKDTPGA